MSTQVLARKWRPQSFTEVIGQTAIVQALTHALETGRLHHAYLFSGTRGIGKTSSARLLAKCLSCVQGITATPCGQCDACVGIATGTYLDLLEIDAASRTKVEDTRDLLDSVHYPPIQGRYKIILIDEVHMLSGHSFNALLKTLEEPPKHVIFLLATTEPEKLPNTILSRCLHFTLKPLSIDALSTHFQNILQQEQIAFESSAIDLIAKAAHGSVRDGLSILEQAMAYCHNNITTAKISELLGVADRDSIQQLFTAVITNEAETVFTLIRSMAENGVDFNEALSAFIELLHQQSLQHILQKNTDKLSAERLQLYYQIALIGRRDLPLAPDPQIGFEMIFIRLLAFQPWQESAVEDSSKKKILTNATRSNIDKQAVSKSTPPVHTHSDLVVSEATSISTKAMYTDIPDLGEQAPPTATTRRVDWPQLYAKLNLNGLCALLASHSVLLSQEQDHWQFALDPSQAALYSKEQETILAEALSRYFAKPITVSLQVTAANATTPAHTHAQLQQAARFAAEKNLTENAHFRQILEQFHGTIVHDSIQHVETEQTSNEVKK